MSKYIFPAAPRVLRIAANKLGRDFIVGDIHGAFDMVLAAMRAVNFDPARDRIFVVGDNIDRGPDSWRCARFLRLPYVISCLGNHEAMVLDLYRSGRPDEALLLFVSRHNGFGWWMDITEEQRVDILKALAELPIVVELETSRGTVGLVHADVPAGMNWSTFVGEIEAGNPTVTETALWGRERILSGNEDGVEGIGRVFVGHTPQWNGMRRYANVFAVDSGAVFAHLGLKKEGRLTFAEAVCTTQILSAPTPHTLIDVRQDPPGFGGSSAPFGAYTKSGLAPPPRTFR